MCMNAIPPEHSNGDPASPQIAALLLAAGLSKRMGSLNKLLADIGSEPMVRHTARTFLACGLDIFAVTGHQRREVEAALSGLGLTFIFNPDYRDGQQGSVRTGLNAIGSGYDAVIVALCDQPLLNLEDIQSLLAAFARSARDKFIIPFFAGQRGNPVIIPRSIIQEIATQPVNMACRRFTDRFPDRIERYDAPNDHFIRDIDTAEALLEFRNS